MFILGLTGSIATGKTTVAEMFENVGIPVFHSDKTVHKLFKTRKRLQNALNKEFPGSVKNNRVDREILGKKVFGRPRRLARLEQIVHPYVLREMNKFLNRCRKEGTRLVVLDIPLLYEIGAEDICNAVLVVTVSKGLQRKRALSRGNLNASQFEEILIRQIDDAEKRRRADYIIDTGNPLKTTRGEVEKLVAKLAGKGHK